MPTISPSKTSPCLTARPKVGRKREALMLETGVKRFILNNAEVDSFQDTFLGNTTDVTAYFNNSLIQGDVGLPLGWCEPVRHQLRNPERSPPVVISPRHEPPPARTACPLSIACSRYSVTGSSIALWVVIWHRQRQRVFCPVPHCLRQFHGAGLRGTLPHPAIGNIRTAT